MHGAGPAIPAEMAYQQWLVDPSTGGLLSILTPVFPDDASLMLLANQLRTFAHYFDGASVSDWLFIAPMRLRQKLESFLQVCWMEMVNCGYWKELDDNICRSFARSNAARRSALWMLQRWCRLPHFLCFHSWIVS
jgi:hypothetical protein